jgi:tRNA1Val (adenine37-N6)-methyltransferase
MTDDLTEYTRDTFYNGALTVWQERSGYRFSIDPVLLAGHTPVKPGDRVVDLGTGCGIIPLMLGYWHPGTVLLGVEIQEALVRLARRNAAVNIMENRIRVLHCDLKTLNPEMVQSPVDVVVCNPPYRRINSGKLNPNAQKAVARHELKVTLSDIVAAAARIMKVSGRFVVIYPATRTTDLIVNMRKGGIEPKWIRTVHSHKNGPAKMVIARGVKGGGPEMEIAPPLCIYEEDGSYTGEVQRMFEPVGKGSEV